MALSTFLCTLYAQYYAHNKGIVQKNIKKYELINLLDVKNN